jgi:hypothetical protein
MLNRRSRLWSQTQRARGLGLCVILLTVACLVGCRQAQDDNYTPPPATIIRSSDQVVATPTQGQAQPTEAAVATQPAAPAQPGQSTSPYPYPFPTSSAPRQPAGTPPPGVYPTP